MSMADGFLVINLPNGDTSDYVLNDVIYETATSLFSTGLSGCVALSYSTPLGH